MAVIWRGSCDGCHRTCTGLAPAERDGETRWLCPVCFAGEKNDTAGSLLAVLVFAAVGLFAWLLAGAVTGK